MLWAASMQHSFAADPDFVGAPASFIPPADHALDAFPRNSFMQSPHSQWGPPSALSSAPHPTLAPMDTSISNSSPASSAPTSISGPPRPVRPPLQARASRKRSRDVFVEDEASAGLGLPTPSSTTGVEGMEIIEERPNPIADGQAVLNSSGMPTPGSAWGSQFQDPVDGQVPDSPPRTDDEADGILADARPAKSVRLSAIPPLTPEASGILSATPGVFQPTSAPIIDAASMTLGVGWREIPQPETANGAAGATDSDLAAAYRGWERYIENHYPLSSVRILLKSDSHEAFCVRAHLSAAAAASSIMTLESSQPISIDPQGTDTWWLFREDLSEARLLACDWSTCVRCLQSGALPDASSSIVLQALKTPAAVASAPAGSNPIRNIQPGSLGAGNFMEHAMPIEDPLALAGAALPFSGGMDMD